MLEWPLGSTARRGAIAAARLRILGSALSVALATAGHAGETPLSATALDAIVAANGSAHGIPAQAVFVSHNGKRVYQRYVGTRIVGRVLPVGPDTVFPIYSVSKLFAATLLFQQVEAGKVNLDTPAVRYAPSLPAAWRAITVRQFLNHASGVPEYFDETDPRRPFPPTLGAVFAALSDHPLLFQPGTQSRYTSTNFLVVEAILEAVTGEPYRELVRTRLIAPLGLKQTWLNSAEAPGDRLVANYLGANGRIKPEEPIPWQPYALSHVGVCMTAADLARFLDAVADGRLVSTATLVTLWKPYVLANGEGGDFASGWDYGEDGPWRGVGHDGAAKLRVRILYRQDLADHYVIVYLTNGAADNAWSRKLVDSVQTRILPP